MKQKILFSGNCQVGVISQYFSRNNYLNELFEVVKIDDSCYPLPAWRDDKTNFALWGHDEATQRAYLKSVHEKIKQADIFVFQKTSKSSIQELQTEYLCERVSTGKNICIPNMRVFIYCNDNECLFPYRKYAKTKVNNPNDEKEIDNFLKSSDDPELRKILELDYPISTFYKERRNENHKRAKHDSETFANYICMENFIKENFKNKILFHKHNHPRKEYFIELLRLLLINLELVDFNINEKDILEPISGKGRVNPMRFKFFRKYFPTLCEPKNK